MHYPIYAEFINFQPPGMKQPHKKHKTTRCSLKQIESEALRCGIKIAYNIKMNSFFFDFVFDQYLFYFYFFYFDKYIKETYYTQFKTHTHR